MLDWLKSNTTSVREMLASEVSRFRNREFMEATISGCALVAAADGEISSSEKQKMAGFIQNSAELKVFDMSEVIQFFNQLTEKFAFDTEIGRAEALRYIGKLRGNDDAGRLLVRVCCAIGSSDGDFDDSEKAACRTIATELGYNPADFNL